MLYFSVDKNGSVSRPGRIGPFPESHIVWLGGPDLAHGS